MSNINERIITETHEYLHNDTLIRGLSIIYKGALIMEFLSDGTFTAYLGEGDVMQTDMLIECVSRYNSWKYAGYP